MTAEKFELNHISDDDEKLPYLDLVDDLRVAVEKEDLGTLGRKTDEWSEVLGRDLPREVWQELYLANPLVEAVRGGHHNVVQYLVNTKGMTLERPCRRLCSCFLCQTLREDARFLQLYTTRVLAALISWTYVVVADSYQPIDSCLKTWEAIVSSGLYNSYAHESLRKELRGRVDATIVRCLDCTINENEVHLLVCEEDDSGDDEAVSLHKIQEILSANLKAAATHPAIQSLIMTHWVRDADLLFGRRYRNSKQVPFFVRYFVHLFVYVVVVPLSIFFPHPRIIRFLRSPTTVYANEALSYWIFLIVLTTTFFNKQENSFFIICRPQVDLFHIVVSIIILARFVRICDGVHRLGFNFFVSPYEIMQSLSTSMYITGMTMLLIAATIVPKKADARQLCLSLAYNYSGNNVSADAALDKLLSVSVTQCQAIKAFYNLNPLYTQFINDAIMPHNLASFFFAIGHLFYYLSAGNVLYMNRLVCHLNIAVTKMFGDVIRWLMLMVLFYFAWALAMVSLYSNYACENSIFSSVQSALLEMFWVLFGMTGTTDYQLKGPLTTYDHVGAYMIQYTGLALYGSYFIVAPIVLVNLLIALMSVTYQKIANERIQEMTFWRSKIQLKYVFWHKRSAIPSPFNILYPIAWLTQYFWKHRCRSTCRSPAVDAATNESKESQVRKRHRAIVRLLNRHRYKSQDTSMQKKVFNKWKTYKQGLE